MDKLSRTTNGDLTYYVYDGNVVIEEQDEDNDETARNVYGRNLITRETSDGLVAYSYNGHSDVIAICNIDGDTLVTYEYDEFGNVTSETVIDEDFANFDNPYRYAGYEYIEEVKLYDLNARYYNPEIARFLSPDPYYNLGNRVIGLYEINVPNAWSIIQANNIYVYCGNNAIAFLDSMGLELTERDKKYLSFADQDLIIRYTAEYERLEEALNYKGMNDYSQKMADIRYKSYPESDPYTDTYDYTHGGKYQIYVNYRDDDSSFYNSGYYEYVYAFDNVYDLKVFALQSSSDYFSETSSTPSLWEDICQFGIGFFKIGTIIDVLMLGNNDLKRTEEKAVNGFTSITSEYATNLSNCNYTYYVYFLDGNYSREATLRVVDSYNNAIFTPKTFDFRQNQAFEIYLKNVDPDNLVAINRRQHTYTYTMS